MKNTFLFSGINQLQSFRAKLDLKTEIIEDLSEKLDILGARAGSGLFEQGFSNSKNIPWNGIIMIVQINLGHEFHRGHVP